MLNQMLLEQVKRDREREVRQRMLDCRAPHRPSSSSIRRAIGRSIMSIGAFVAAEPQPGLARSR